MADEIQLKRSNVPGLAPAASELLDGELALNTADALLYAKNSSGSVVTLNPAPAVQDIKSGGTNVKVTPADGVYTISVESPPSQQSDWSQTDPADAQFILNKPTALSAFTNDKGFVDADGAAQAAPVQDIRGSLVTSIDGVYTIAAVSQAQADWSEANEEQPSYIRNKPTALSKFTNDQGYVTLAQAAAAAPIQSISAADGTIEVGGQDGDITLRAVVAVPEQKQADWSEPDSTSVSYIQSKPTKVSEFTNDKGYVNASAAADAAPVQEIVSGANVSVTAVDGVYTISAAQNPGTVTKVSGVLPISVANETTNPQISVAEATTDSPGVVRLAGQADIEGGVPGAVVDAAQFSASVPTKLSQLTNDSGYVTQSAVNAAVNGCLPLTGGTITGSLVVSPGGSVTVPTPAERDSSQQAATTEWVQRELSSLADQESSWLYGGTDTSTDPGVGNFRLSADGLFLAISKYDAVGGLVGIFDLNDGDAVLIASPADAAAAAVARITRSWWAREQGGFVYSWND